MFGFRKKNIERLVPPMKGEVVALDQVPDLVFSKKMVGDGFAVIPEDGMVVAPVSGKVVQIFPTNHAFGILTDSGLEILVHIGIDTVELKGQGFSRCVSLNDEVEVGTPIVEVDLDHLKKQGKALITPVVITNTERIKNLKIHVGRGMAYAAEVEITLKK